MKMNAVLFGMAMICAAPFARSESATLNYSIAEINAAIGNSLAMHESAASYAVVNHPDVLINATFSSTTWADIDLSSVVGTQSALVMIAVTSSVYQTVSFRQNGEANEVAAGTTSGLVLAGAVSYWWVPTDSNGVLEGKTPDGSVSIRLASFIVAAGE